MIDLSLRIMIIFYIDWQESSRTTAAINADRSTAIIRYFIVDLKPYVSIIELIIVGVNHILL
jgi:hypothetical protein